MRWAALYEGEYTADTLPPYVPKGYAEELAECQRYYFPVLIGANTYMLCTRANGDTFKVYIPAPTMRGSPSAELHSSGACVFLPGSVWSDAVTLSLYGKTAGYYVYSFTPPSDTLQIGVPYLIKGIKALNADL